MIGLLRDEAENGLNMTCSVPEITNHPSGSAKFVLMLL